MRRPRLQSTLARAVVPVAAGIGFFALGGRAGDEQPNLRHHLGVSIMRERAQQLAGRIEIANLPGGGARVRLAFPADPAARASSQIGRAHV